MDFAKTLADAREKAGLSQWELSRKTGISRGLLSLIETGKRTPPLDCLTQLLDALNLSQEDRKVFEQAAYLAHAPGKIQSLVRHLQLAAARDRGELLQLQGDYAALAAQLQKITAYLQAKGYQLPDG